MRVRLIRTEDHIINYGVGQVFVLRRTAFAKLHALRRVYLARRLNPQSREPSWEMLSNRITFAVRLEARWVIGPRGLLYEYAPNGIPDSIFIYVTTKYLTTDLYVQICLGRHTHTNKTLRD